MKKIPLAGYCEICGSTTSVIGSSTSISSDNIMNLYELKTPDGKSRKLCFAHYQQEVVNTKPINASGKEEYKERLENAFQSIFPQFRNRNNS